MIKYYFFPIILFLTLFTSCSSDDETLVNDVVRKMRMLTITQVERDDATRSLVDLTRASLNKDEGGKTLTASWTAGDPLAYCNLNYLFNSNLLPASSILGTLTAQSTAENSDFKGSIECAQGDRIALAFPINVSNISYNTNNATFTLDLRGQNGTLETLANNYHFVCGIADITSVTDNTASATIQMKSLLTVCKFSFVDENDKPILVKKLSICYADKGYGDFGENTYPTSTSITLSSGDIFENVIAIGKLDPNEEILTIDNSNGLNEVYVALFPTGTRDYKFSVMNDNGTFVGKATANLIAGKFVLGNLKLTKQTNN